MTRELNRVALAALLGFALAALTLGYWAIVRADDLLEREDNARSVIAEQRIARGAILGREGVRLAYSEEVDDTGRMRRVYPYPAAAPALGYYSLTYGEAGIEDAADGVLRGAGGRGAWRTWWDDTLHRAPVGGDVRATVDLGVQRAAAGALGGAQGAAVVVEVPSGALLALVSQPSYDPNTLDRDWDRLAADAHAPLLNRATAGAYQPGGAWQTALLAALLAEYPDLVAQADGVLYADLPDAAAPVALDELKLFCLPGTPDEPLTLAAAYAWGCPAPFARALDGATLTPARLWERLGVMGLVEPPALPGYPAGTGRPPKPLTDATTPAALEAALVGQGALTLTPLQLAQFIAAIANGGSAVPLHAIDAVRPPGSDAWQPEPLPARRAALMRADVAAVLAQVMQQAAAANPVIAGAWPDAEALHGHVGLAYAGPEHTPYAWFAGYVTVSQASAEGPLAVAVVVVVEDEADPMAAVRVARAAFEAALGEGSDDAAG